MNYKLNDECSVFRDLYPFYKSDELEEDTVKWIEDHEKKCIKCRKWLHKINNNFKLIEDTEEKSIKKAKGIMFLGVGIIILLAIWTSIWIFI